MKMLLKILLLSVLTCSAAFAQTPIRTDTADRANAASLGTPSDAGSAWQTWEGTGHGIISNTIRGSTTNDTTVSDYLDTILTADQYGKAIIINRTNNHYHSIWLRFNGNTGSPTGIQLSIGNGSELYITEFVGGVSDQLATGSSPHAEEVEMEARVVGTAVSLLLGGAVVLGPTTTTVTGTGRGAIETYSGNSGALDTQMPRFDDIEFGNLGEAEEGTGLLLRRRRG